MEIREARGHDAEKILALQKHAPRSEAEFYNDFRLPLLVPTLSERGEESGRLVCRPDILDHQGNLYRKPGCNPFE